MTEPEVHILLLNYNSLAKLAACVASLERLDYSNYKLLLIDNGSPDGSGLELQRLFPAHRVLLNGANLGYAAGNRSTDRATSGEAGGQLDVQRVPADTGAGQDSLRAGAARRDSLARHPSENYHCAPSLTQEDKYSGLNLYQLPIR